MIERAPDDEPLPQPGPPFRIGEEIAFFPAEFETLEDPGWLRWDYAVIADIDEPAGSIGFYFLATPHARHAQGMENIVRRTAGYLAWRSAFEAALAATGDPTKAHAQTHELWVRVMAEHPIHGGSRFPHAVVAARRAAASGG